MYKNGSQEAIENLAKELSLHHLELDVSFTCIRPRERISPIHTKMLFPEGAETNAVGRHSQDQNRSLHPELY